MMNTSVNVFIGCCLFTISSCSPSSNKEEQDQKAQENIPERLMNHGVQPFKSKLNAITDLSFDQTLLDSLKKPYSIVDYFLLIPTQLLGTANEKKAILKTEKNPVATVGGCFPNIREMDRKNAFMSYECSGDGGYDGFQITYWKVPGESDLVGINKTNGGMCCDQSDIIFLRLEENVWKNVTSEVLPSLTYGVFMKPGESDPNETMLAPFIADLPQQGKNISVRIMDDIGEGILAESQDLLKKLDLGREVILSFQSGKFTRQQLN